MIKIVLCMIVKNEAAVIRRCLESVLPFIDAYAIIDTGSTDGTQEIAREALRSVPGVLVINEPWEDFSTNRNQALEFAATFGDYALVIDADDTLEWNKKQELTAPAYNAEYLYGTTRYQRPALIKLGIGWYYKGVLHEALVNDTPGIAEQTKLLPGFKIRVHSDGARSQRSEAEKFSADAEVLRKALEAEPDNARYVFYYAQSLRDAGQIVPAIKAYEKRVSMGGWDQEIYYSLLQIAVLKERTKDSYESVVSAYLDAYNFRPSRAEAPCELARYLRLNGRYAAAAMFANIAVNLVETKDVLFIDSTVYDWRAEDELAVAHYWCGFKSLSAIECEDLLAHKKLPESERARVQKNTELARC